MRVLIVGNGGREHALAWKIAQANNVTHIFVAPGNPGTALEPRTQNINIAATDISALIKFAQQENIDLTIVGPEAPLALGIVDAFQAAKLHCFGPSKAAAQLEASKVFSKDFMSKYKIPTARYASFSDVATAKDYLQHQSMPIVIKADGLAAGKGVIIAQTLIEASAAVESLLSSDVNKQTKPHIVIEEFLQGEEASFIVITDGKTILPLATSQDHKTRDNGDQGPNTGGMGAYSPAPMITPTLHQQIIETIIKPTLAGLAAEGRPYLGFLYAGLMITAAGPKVLEFNCRLGDPETQPIMMRLQANLADICLQTLTGQLANAKIAWDPRPALGVVLAAKGYPFSYPKGEIISGLNEINEPNCKVFHAGTALQNNHIITAGGRVLCVTALGETIQSAQTTAYQAVRHIKWQHQYYRTDIGAKAIKHFLESIN